MNRYVTIVVKIIAGTGMHGIPVVDARTPVIPAVIHAVVTLVLAVAPGAGFGGLFSPILGRVADTQGVDVVMWIMFAICVVAAVSTVILPEDPDLKVKNS